METTCEEDLKDDNPVVSETLTGSSILLVKISLVLTGMIVIGLRAYELMRKTACLPDQTTNTYCYIEAVTNSNPADSYFYTLPLGLQLPDNISPSCSACTKSVMSLYALDGSNLTALNQVYDGAAEVADKACGSGYVQITTVNANAVARLRAGQWLWTGMLGMVVGAVVALW